ncbi:MAG: MBOAT family O-acyltransferase [Sphingomonadaceae bacterium]
MLFNSLPFIFLFLPVTLAGFYFLQRTGRREWVYLFLVAASLVFYAVWNPPYVLLLVGSMLGNYLCARWIERRMQAGHKPGIALLAGILGNLAFLGYYKYANFFVDTVNSVAGTDWTLAKIILPLAISFYTLQQIAFLVDIARGEVRTAGLFRFATFVIFFPQLIAGPIVHYKEMMPQFFGRAAGRFPAQNLTIGAAIFAIGLFKKTVIADSAALFSSPVYAAARAGEAISFADGWIAAIGFTIQVYFDFSGYSDMAIGLARMFGVRLPLNFHSPLRAVSITEYWRRWHMTLQRFIAAYIYQPMVLPLTRWAATRGLGKWPEFGATTALPLVIAFVIVGLWHGAAWTYVVFGLIHGVYLSINEAWRLWRRKSRRKDPPGTGSIAFYHALTVAAVVFSNVMFRAETVGDAVTIWRAMVSPSAQALAAFWPDVPGDVFAKPTALFLAAVVLITFFPNTQQLMRRYGPALDFARWAAVGRPAISLVFRPTPAWAVAIGLILFLGLAFILRGATEFIYFNF